MTLTHERREFHFDMYVRKNMVVSVKVLMICAPVGGMGSAPIAYGVKCMKKGWGAKFWGFSFRGFPVRF